MTPKEEIRCEVGDVSGDMEGEMAVLILAESLRRMAILNLAMVDCWCMTPGDCQVQYMP